MKRILPENTVFSADQSAIFEAIQSKKNNRHEIVLITDSLSTIMAAENRTPTKNPKTQTIRKMLDHKGPGLPSYGSPVTREYQVMKRLTKKRKKLDEDIPTTERYPPDDLKKWLTEEDFKKRDQRWKNGNNKMKERKPDVDRKEDTEMNAKERSSGNIQRQNRVDEVHPRLQDGRGQQSTMPLP
jgi:hypothetical protein